MASRLKRICALSIGANLGLILFVAVVKPCASEPEGISLQQVLDDPRVRRQVISELVFEAKGIWDSHNDPDVGRVLQPMLDRQDGRVGRIASNRFGMREREYAVPKPPGLIRVVILGDSLVYGLGVREEDRVGVFLEEYLNALVEMR